MKSDQNSDEENLANEKKLRQQLAENLNLDNILQQNPLQSPIESHFALTPIVQSKTHSPANGFTSVDCSNILCQELDQLEKQVDSNETSTNDSSNLIMEADNWDIDWKIESEKNNLENIDNLLSPVDENISMFAQLPGAAKPADNVEDISDNVIEQNDAEVFNTKSFKKEVLFCVEVFLNI